jgi:hypothetical protein
VVDSELAAVSEARDLRDIGGCRKATELSDVSH